MGTLLKWISSKTAGKPKFLLTLHSGSFSLKLGLIEGIVKMFYG